MIWSGFWRESDGNLPFPCLMVRNCAQFFSVFKLFWVDNVVRVYLKQATNQGWALHARAYPEWHHQLLGKMPGPLVDSELSWLQSTEALKPGMNQEAATEKTYFTAFSSLLAVSPSNVRFSNFSQMICLSLLPSTRASSLGSGCLELLGSQPGRWRGLCDVTIQFLESEIQRNEHEPESWRFPTDAW